MKAFLFALLLAAPGLAHAETLTVKSGTVEFVARGKPQVMTIEGKGGVPTGTVILDGGKAIGNFECQLAALTTGIDLRDQHMREKYLQVATYAKASLKIDQALISDAGFPWMGTLTLKGVTRRVAGVAKVHGGDLWARFTINLDDFAIGVPSWLGVTVANDVEVTVKAAVAP